MRHLKPYAKALVLLALIILAGITDALGMGLGLEVEHYVALLVADILVYFVPNKEPVE